MAWKVSVTLSNFSLGDVLYDVIVSLKTFWVDFSYKMFYFSFFQLRQKCQKLRRNKNIISALAYDPWDWLFFFFNTPGDWSIAVAENYLIDFSGTEGSIYFLRNLNFFSLLFLPLMHWNFFFPNGLSVSHSPYALSGSWTLESLACSLHLVWSNTAQEDMPELLFPPPQLS